MNATGRQYEDNAAAMLRASGLLVLERNFSCRAGEIDIIARDGDQLVFVEVRARGNRHFDSAAGSVNAGKRQRIIRTAQVFLQRRPQWAHAPCRFDVIAFEPPQSGTISRVRWIRSAFTT